jgi:hypothetical protein
MLFYNYNKVNKLVFLRHKLYLVFLCLLKTALINLIKRSIVLLSRNKYRDLESRF